jgi:hypothetical protein
MGTAKFNVGAVAKVFSAGAQAYRNEVAVADLLAVPGTVTCTKEAGGSATAGEYTVFVIAGNSFGRTTAKQGNTTVTTETTNLTIRAAFAAVVNAEYYDIYGSIDGAAAKWVGRITEAERASGIKIDAVGSTSAGGIAGAVDIEVPGTGLAANAASNAVNTAFVVPSAKVNCAGYRYADFDLNLTRTGDAAVPAVTVVPFYHNERIDTWYAGTPIALTLGGAAGVYNTLKQRLRLETRSNDAVALAVASISGTGATLDIDATIS